MIISTAVGLRLEMNIEYLPLSLLMLLASTQHLRKSGMEYPSPTTQWLAHTNFEELHMGSKYYSQGNLFLKTDSGNTLHEEKFQQQEPKKLLPCFSRIQIFN